MEGSTSNIGGLIRYIWTMHKMNKFIFASFAALIMLSVPTLGATADILQASIIYHSDASQRAVGFRKQFQVPTTGANANLFIFADNRYQLWINGQFVWRGPARFDPKRPEYDSLNVGSYLTAGTNTIAVLVYGHVTNSNGLDNRGNGRSMDHAPGLAVQVVGQGFSVSTDNTWRCSNNTRFRPPAVDWADVKDRVDATFETGDWLLPDFIDTAWPTAVAVAGSQWGLLHSRITPLLRSTVTPYTITGRTLPFQVTGATTLTLSLARNIVGYVVLDFDADAGSVIVVGGRHQYTARAGRQTYLTGEAFGSGSQSDVNTLSLTIQVNSGRVNFFDIKIFNYIYPFDRAASFTSNDAMLNRYWEVMAHSLPQMSEDGYEDCPWERAEWMGGMDHVYDFTRVAFSAPGPNGSPVYGDSRLMAKMIMDIGQSQQADGRIKAHHPSDRWDIHGYIEDYNCVWMWDIWQHYQVTGDKAFVAELWPVVQKQLKLFQDSIKTNGLINAREFFIFDNPYAYQVCQGATLNAFLYKALLAAASLAGVVQSPADSIKYAGMAMALKNSFNSLLWDPVAGTFKGRVGGNVTLHAAVTALYSGIVSQANLPSTQSWLLRQDAGPIAFPWIFNYWFRDLYSMNSDVADQAALQIIRTKFNNTWNANNPGYVTSEANNGGRNFHCYGMVPGYFFGAYLLGVQADLPVSNKRISIQPRLGDLTSASGTVVTEHGLVPVTWARSDTSLDFTCNVPTGTTARMSLPVSGRTRLVVDGLVKLACGVPPAAGVSVDSRSVSLDLGPGPHTGHFGSPSKNLALNTAVSASSSVTGSGWSTANATDGLQQSLVSSLGWSSSSNLTVSHREWVAVDLGSAAQVDQVVLYPRTDAGSIGYGFPQDFTIQVSKDSLTWDTVATLVGYALPSGVAQRFAFAARPTVRYVKIDGTLLRPNPNDANQYRMQFAEIEIPGLACLPVGILPGFERFSQNAISEEGVDVSVLALKSSVKTINLHFHLVEKLTEVSIGLYTSKGREVRSLKVKNLNAGLQTVEMTSRDSQDQPLMPGTYYCRIQSNRLDKTVKVVLPP